ncbi:Imm19 family immunity protein [Maribacter sp. BPC-D8]|uniref:Imm19 family immunity protein n=1 Tax=Maribacter sp. BPC-D8 TaxID=3053613 RepID=UPI002B490E6B|nr:Imm19 family immunity protein [Maribacter sp. BPC-D8]WRI28601.1 Imm19 family immunity protein [Maribacter sp. BPC-D8]
MENLITRNDIMENQTFFWFSYFSWFRGFDEINELNIDEALANVIQVDTDKINKWSETFFSSINGKQRFIGGKLSKNLSFQIEFLEEEITFYINEQYIGNLGGHFEAWYLTLDEISVFEKYDFIFLLLLPMVGITKNELDFTKELISKNLKSIPKFKNQSEYISECIANGLVMHGEFYTDEKIGIVNNQNHSVRNINKYPDYRENVLKLNNTLK